MFKIPFIKRNKVNFHKSKTKNENRYNVLCIKQKKNEIFFDRQISYNLILLTDAPATETKDRTMECRHWNSSYKVCKVQDAQKVQSIEKIAQFPITSGSQCNRGIDFGIIEDSIWINNGCNGIYKVEYYTGIVLNSKHKRVTKN